MWTENIIQVLKKHREQLVHLLNDYVDKKTDKIMSIKIMNQIKQIKTEIVNVDRKINTINFIEKINPNKNKSFAEIKNIIYQENNKKLEKLKQIRMQKNMEINRATARLEKIATPIAVQQQVKYMQERNEEYLKDIQIKTSFDDDIVMSLIIFPEQRVVNDFVKEQTSTIDIYTESFKELIVANYVDKKYEKVPEVPVQEVSVAPLPVSMLPSMVYYTPSSSSLKHVYVDPVPDQIKRQEQIIIATLVNFDRHDNEKSLHSDAAALVQILDDAKAIAVANIDIKYKTNIDTMELEYKTKYAAIDYSYTKRQTEILAGDVWCKNFTNTETKYNSLLTDNKTLITEFSIGNQCGTDAEYQKMNTLFANIATNFSTLNTNKPLNVDNIITAKAPNNTVDYAADITNQLSDLKMEYDACLAIGDAKTVLDNIDSKIIVSNTKVDTFIAELEVITDAAILTTKLSDGKTLVNELDAFSLELKTDITDKKITHYNTEIQKCNDEIVRIQEKYANNVKIVNAHFAEAKACDAKLQTIRETIDSAVKEPYITDMNKADTQAAHNLYINSFDTMINTFNTNLHDIKDILNVPITILNKLVEDGLAITSKIEAYLKDFTIEKDRISTMFDDIDIFDKKLTSEGKPAVIEFDKLLVDIDTINIKTDYVARVGLLTNEINKMTLLVDEYNALNTIVGTKMLLNITTFITEIMKKITDFNSKITSINLLFEGVGVFDKYVSDQNDDAKLLANTTINNMNIVDVSIFDKFILADLPSALIHLNGYITNIETKFNLLDKNVVSKSKDIIVHKLTINNLIESLNAKNAQIGGYFISAKSVDNEICNINNEYNIDVNNHRETVDKLYSIWAYDSYVNGNQEKYIINLKQYINQIDLKLTDINVKRRITKPSQIIIENINKSIEGIPTEKKNMDSLFTEVTLELKEIKLQILLFDGTTDTFIKNVVAYKGPRNFLGFHSGSNTIKTFIDAFELRKNDIEASYNTIIRNINLLDSKHIIILKNTVDYTNNITIIELCNTNVLNTYNTKVKEYTDASDTALADSYKTLLELINAEILNFGVDLSMVASMVNITVLNDKYIYYKYEIEIINNMVIDYKTKFYNEFVSDSTNSAKVISILDTEYKLSIEAIEKTITDLIPKKNSEYKQRFISLLNPSIESIKDQHESKLKIITEIIDAKINNKLDYADLIDTKFNSIQAELKGYLEKIGDIIIILDTPHDAIDLSDNTINKLKINLTSIKSNINTNINNLDEYKKNMDNGYSLIGELKNIVDNFENGNVISPELAPNQIINTMSDFVLDNSNNFNSFIAKFSNIIKVINSHFNESEKRMIRIKTMIDMGIQTKIDFSTKINEYVTHINTLNTDIQNKFNENKTIYEEGDSKEIDRINGINDIYVDTQINSLNVIEQHINGFTYNVDNTIDTVSKLKTYHLSDLENIKNIVTRYNTVISNINSPDLTKINELDTKLIKCILNSKSINYANITNKLNGIKTTINEKYSKLFDDIINVQIVSVNEKVNEKKDSIKDVITIITNNKQNYATITEFTDYINQIKTDYSDYNINILTGLDTILKEIKNLVNTDTIITIIIKNEFMKTLNASTVALSSLIYNIDEEINKVISLLDVIKNYINKLNVIETKCNITTFENTHHSDKKYAAQLELNLLETSLKEINDTSYTPQTIINIIYGIDNIKKIFSNINTYTASLTKIFENGGDDEKIEKAASDFFNKLPILYTNILGKEPTVGDLNLSENYKTHQTYSIYICNINTIYLFYNNSIQASYGILKDLNQIETDICLLTDSVKIGTHIAKLTNEYSTTNSIDISIDAINNLCKSKITSMCNSYIANLEIIIDNQIFNTENIIITGSSALTEQTDYDESLKMYNEFISIIQNYKMEIYNNLDVDVDMDMDVDMDEVIKNTNTSANVLFNKITETFFNLSTQIHDHITKIDKLKEYRSIRDEIYEIFTDFIDLHTNLKSMREETTDVGYAFNSCNQSRESFRTYKDRINSIGTEQKKIFEKIAKFTTDDILLANYGDRLQSLVNNISAIDIMKQINNDIKYLDEEYSKYKDKYITINTPLFVQIKTDQYKRIVDIIKKHEDNYSTNTPVDNNIEEWKINIDSILSQLTLKYNKFKKPITSDNISNMLVDFDKARVDISNNTNDDLSIRINALERIYTKIYNDLKNKHALVSSSVPNSVTYNKYDFILDSVNKTYIEINDIQNLPFVLRIYNKETFYTFINSEYNKELYSTMDEHANTITKENKISVDFKNYIDSIRVKVDTIITYINKYENVRGKDFDEADSLSDALSEVNISNENYVNIFTQMFKSQPPLKFEDNNDISAIILKYEESNNIYNGTTDILKKIIKHNKNLYSILNVSVSHENFIYIYKKYYEISTTKEFINLDSKFQSQINTNFIKLFEIEISINKVENDIKLLYESLQDSYKNYKIETGLNSYFNKDIFNNNKREYTAFFKLTVTTLGNTKKNLESTNNEIFTLINSITIDESIQKFISGYYTKISNSHICIKKYIEDMKSAIQNMLEVDTCNINNSLRNHEMSLNMIDIKSRQDIVTNNETKLESRPLPSIGKLNSFNANIVNNLQKTNNIYLIAMDIKTENKTASYLKKIILNKSKTESNHEIIENKYNEYYSLFFEEYFSNLSNKYDDYYNDTHKDINELYQIFEKQIETLTYNVETNSRFNTQLIIINEMLTNIKGGKLISPPAASTTPTSTAASTTPTSTAAPAAAPTAAPTAPTSTAAPAAVPAAPTSTAAPGLLSGLLDSLDIFATSTAVSPAIPTAAVSPAAAPGLLSGLFDSFDIFATSTAVSPASGIDESNKELIAAVDTLRNGMNINFADSSSRIFNKEIDKIEIDKLSNSYNLIMNILEASPDLITCNKLLELIDDNKGMESDKFIEKSLTVITKLKRSYRETYFVKISINGGIEWVDNSCYLNSLIQLMRYLYKYEYIVFNGKKIELLDRFTGLPILTAEYTEPDKYIVKMIKDYTTADSVYNDYKINAGLFVKEIQDLQLKKINDIYHTLNKLCGLVVNQTAIYYKTHSIRSYATGSLKTIGVPNKVYIIRSMYKKETPSNLQYIIENDIDIETKYNDTDTTITTGTTLGKELYYLDMNECLFIICDLGLEDNTANSEKFDINTYDYTKFKFNHYVQIPKFNKDTYKFCTLPKIYYIYKVVGIICFTGTHYTCYLNENAKWIQYDDTSPRYTEIDNIASEFEYQHKVPILYLLQKHAMGHLVNSNGTLIREQLGDAYNCETGEIVTVAPPTSSVSGGSSIYSTNPLKLTNPAQFVGGYIYCDTIMPSYHSIFIVLVIVAMCCLIYLVVWPSQQHRKIKYWNADTNESICDNRHRRDSILLTIT